MSVTVVALRSNSTGEGVTTLVVMSTDREAAIIEAARLHGDLEDAEIMSFDDLLERSELRHVVPDFVLRTFSRPPAFATWACMFSYNMC